MSFNFPHSSKTLLTGLFLSLAMVVAGNSAQAGPFTKATLIGAPTTLSPAADANFRAQAAALKAVHDALTPVQRKIDFCTLEESRRLLGTSTLSARIATFKTGVQVSAGGMTLVQVAADVTPQLLSQVEQLGGQIVSSLPHSFRAHIPLTNVEQIAALPGIHFIGPYAPPQLCGTVDPEGDAAHNGPVTRAQYGVYGDGQTIGVLSDSVDTSPGGALAAAEASGAVGNVNVLTLNGQSQAGSGTGEGLAMLEIVHALAPHATEWFATGASGDTPMAQNIAGLQAAGCNIIVDDIAYFDETPYQDGPIGQAINTFVAQGGLYFTAAGNYNNYDSVVGTTTPYSSTWEGDFANYQSTGYHDWGGGHIYNQVAVGIAGLFLYWSDANGQVTDEYELLITDGSGNIINEGQDLTNDSGQIVPGQFCDGSVDEQGYAVVQQVSGAGRFLHLSNPYGEFFYSTAGAIFGHNGNQSAITCGATDASLTNGQPFNSTAQIESFSSDGPRRFFYQADGTPYTPGNFSSTGGLLVNKPDLTAANGVTTTLPANSDLNPFYGTSAAAPHAAAIAALILSANPGLTNTQVKALMESTAIDIMGKGDDRDSGWGICMPGPAIAAAPLAENISITPASANNPATGTTTLTFPVTLSAANTLPVSVQYATVDGSAVAGTDYTATSGTLTIPPGQTSANIPVTILSRQYFGSNLTFTMGLSNPVNCTIKPPAQVTGTIIETPDVAPEVVSITPTAGSSIFGTPYQLNALYEDGNGNGDLSQMEIEVTSSGSGANALFAMYDKKTNLVYLRDDGNANWLGGFTPGSSNTISNSQGTLNCAATTATLQGADDLAIVWDFTPNASFTGLQNVFGYVIDNEGENSGLLPVTTWNITTPPPGLTVSGGSVRVGATGSVPFTFPVILSRAAQLPVTVNYASADGTAKAGTDYTATSGTVTIPAGTTAGSIVVQVLGTTADASGLTFNMVLSNSVNAPIASGTAACTIIHDSAPVSVSLAPAPPLTNPGAATSMTATYSDADGASDITQAYISVGPEAAPASSLYGYYNAATNLLYLRNTDGSFAGGFAPGSANVITTPLGSLNCAATTVSISGNQLAVTWNLTPGVTLAGTNTVSLNVFDSLNESSGWVNFFSWSIRNLPLISIGNTSVVVGPSGTFNATFTVSLTNSLYPVTVQYATADGTAKAGTDYTATSGTLSIPAGSLSGTITVPVLGTAADASGLTFNLVLSNPTTGILGTATGTCTITHDAGPVAISLTPLPVGTLVNVANTLTETVNDVNSATQITWVKLCVGQLVAPSVSLYASYNATTNSLYLYNANNVAVGGFAPGSKNVITTSLGYLNCAKTTVTKSGSTVVVNWNITPAEPLVGFQPTYIQATDSLNLSSSWLATGIWTIGNPGPALIGVTPLPLTSDSGSTGTLTATYFDGSGASALTGVELCLGPIALPSVSLYAKYNPVTNLLYLFSPNDQAVGGFAPGTNHVITTPLGSLNCASTTVTKMGSEMIVAWCITPATTSGGVFPVNLYAEDLDAHTSWKDFGNWTIYPAGPGVTSVTPLPLSSNAGTPETLTATYRDGGGAGALTRVQFCVGPVGYPSSTLYAEYVQATHLLYLFNASNVPVGGFAPGSNNVITTPLGSLNCANTTVTQSEDELYVGWNISPSTALKGAQAINLYAQDASANTGWKGFGTWTIAAPEPSDVTATPLPQNTSAGSPTLLTATYADGAGASALTELQLCVGPVGLPATTMYVRYNPATNLLYLYNGNDTALGGFAPGSNNVITTNLGSLNCANTKVTRSGNSLVIAWSITPSTALEGVQPVNLYAQDASSNTGWKFFGYWTISAPATPSQGTSAAPSGSTPASGHSS